jgi:hypothetical protein
LARLGVTATLGLLLLPQGAYGSSGALPSDEWNCVFVPARDLTGCSIANHSAPNHDRVHDWPGPGAFVTVEEQSMNVPFPVSLEGARTAAAVPVDQPADLSAALAALGLHAPRLVVVLVGGAGRMRVRDLDRLRPLFEQGLVPGAERLGVVVVDGGTDAGVMHLLGRARTRAGARFPLVGVPAVGTVRFPGRRSEHEDVGRWMRTTPTSCWCRAPPGATRRHGSPG